MATTDVGPLTQSKLYSMDIFVEQITFMDKLYSLNIFGGQIAFIDKLCSIHEYIYVNPIYSSVNCFLTLCAIHSK